MAQATQDKPIQKIHFIGVGGVGMSGIARVAHDQGLVVSGSDVRQSRYTDQLVEAGITVYIGHDAAHLVQGEKEPDIVVVSTAIMENNPELREARARGIEIWHRAKMLAYLGRSLDTLAVAGTHGKTTTSSMLASVIDSLGLNPTFLIGGIVRAYGTNAHAGSGVHYVVEADESDKSFTYLSPKAAIITNVEADHLDHYSGIEEIREQFKLFIGSIPQDGVAVVCGEDPSLVELARESCECPMITYGFGDQNDVCVSNFEPKGVGSTFNVTLPDGKVLDAHIKQNPGIHNALNGSAVLAMMYALGFDVDAACEALGQFAGVRRRFDLVDEVSGITIVDDYAHHPTEIAATIRAAKQLDFKHVHVLFQPHRYSRAPLFTEVLRDEFGSAFDEADYVTFMDVYPAGETPVPGVSGKTFLNVVLDNPAHPQAAYVPRRIDVVPYLQSRLSSGDLIITMGAGDVNAIGPQLADALKKTANKLRGGE